MDVKIDPKYVEELVKKAIFDSLTPETREKLVSDAIASLITAQPNDRNGKSPLQEAFNRAAQSACYEVAQGALRENPVFQEALQKIFTDAIKQLYTPAVSERMSEKIVEAIGKSLDRW